MAKKISDENGNTYVQKKPFYKRVWFWVVVVVVIVVIGLGNMGGSKDSKSSSNSQKVSSSASSSNSNNTSAKTEKTYKVGQVVKVGSMQYTVTGVSTTKSVGPSILPTDAKDTFVVVDLTVKNLGDKEVTIDSSFFKLLDGSKTLSADSSASMSANQDESGQITNSFFLQQLNPDVEMSGKVVFDVSADQAASQSTKLKVQTGSFGTQTAEIKLH
jgi:hypothetical protein